VETGQESEWQKEEWWVGWPKIRKISGMTGLVSSSRLLFKKINVISTIVVEEFLHVF
jgi:hypothetical protein